MTFLLRSQASGKGIFLLLIEPKNSAVECLLLKVINFRFGSVV